MKAQSISWGMSTRLLDRMISDQERIKTLLYLSFDLSEEKNKMAMREFKMESETS